MFRNIPCTDAYLKPGAVYSDYKVRRWLSNPSNTELRFSSRYGEYIPPNYLDLFEKDMGFLYQILYNHQDRYTFTLETHIFFVKMMIDKTARKIILKEVFLRPCAEGHGFFKIILFHITRCCIRLNCDMFVESPFKATSAILKSCFPHELIEETTEYRPQIGKPSMNYFIIRLTTLNSEPLDDNFRLENKLVYDPYRIRLNRPLFPIARTLNFGPGAEGCDICDDMAYVPEETIYPWDY